MNNVSIYHLFFHRMFPNSPLASRDIPFKPAASAYAAAIICAQLEFLK